ncbi:Serpentine receptor class gamma-20 [Caenorhabditis elegans]|uniref:Isoform a of Serpentine receptor class gamma-20 n=1 Tax=Caenorhabditis elegans TaxID=6239 RepID=P91535-2|nr:Serpentine receptor class gamma-20 [Caenorhabditis elegans]CCD63684.1 Serpentine receptor class gamma-20 [Caenorhabditis elegans]|eukprot:NP_001022490.1 Serpentine receptor class gamma-20 [Caenorhabditis elegans]
MSTRLIIPANFSYDDPLPFTCNQDSHVMLSILEYLVQATYLSVSAVLNSMIVYTIFRCKGKHSYRRNPFFVLYAAEAVMNVYSCVIEVLFGRLIIYMTPLCPALSPFFFTPSILTKLYFLLNHYCLAFKTLSQIAISFNRMTCVIFPVHHFKLWQNILAPVLVSLFVLPLGVTWNILVSRVYVNPNGAGFSVNYRDAVAWANISFLHLFHCIPCLFLMIVFFLASIFGLTMLENRLRSAERSLIIFTMTLGVETMLFAIAQIYFAFLAGYLPGIRPLMLLISFNVFDVLYVYSPIALILMNRQLRRDIFHLKGDDPGFLSASSHNQPAARVMAPVMH